MQKDVAMSADRARSLQMQSNIQPMAANFEHIISNCHSVAGGGAYEEASAAAVERSVSRSRIARSLDIICPVLWDL